MFYGGFGHWLIDALLLGAIAWGYGKHVSTLPQPTPLRRLAWSLWHEVVLGLGGFLVFCAAIITLTLWWQGKLTFAELAEWALRFTLLVGAARWITVAGPTMWSRMSIRARTIRQSIRVTALDCTLGGAVLGAAIVWLATR